LWAKKSITQSREIATDIADIDHVINNLPFTNVYMFSQQAAASRRRSTGDSTIA